MPDTGWADAAGLERDDTSSRFSLLLAAAFVTAVRDQFPAGYTRAGIIQLVAQIRARSAETRLWPLRHACRLGFRPVPQR